ncbi:ribonuclease P protein subunit p25-like protein [Lucilia sericata]|uniref:ribonuclease P protein subunit p25-like protein n=1 Tax=Lucilia sericata TaxID=13632 RepID=UPI0018A81BB6|nr:ribonuclease P protein subunit p25-like protein [Lucilia sericata]XP_037826386.1 ribonuclease P protein subunit p25-like protein [Lucilia sericata]
MMHYRKGENIEKQLTKEELPFEDFLPKGTDFLWMHVNGGTKVNNVITYAKNALDKGEYKNIVWSGNGGGVVKTISCAEILKRSYPLYQVTRMCYITVEEHWKPQMEGLEEIVANRQIPSLHIFMSLEPIDDNVNGLQKPNTITDFWVYNNNQNNSATSSNNNSNHRQRNSNQSQRRQHPNQNRNPQQQPPRTNASNNPDTSNEATNREGGNQPRKSNNNNSKRRRPNQGRDTQNAPKKETNTNQTESMEI